MRKNSDEFYDSGEHEQFLELLMPVTRYLRSIVTLIYANYVTRDLTVYTCVRGDKVIINMLQLFEGMKAYRGVDDKIRLFRPELNMERMNLAAQRSGLPTFDGEELIKCVSRLIQIDQEWVPHSETSTLYLRPTLIGTEVSESLFN